MIKMTDLLEQVVLKLYEGRKKKEETASGEEKKVKAKKIPKKKEDSNSGEEKEVEVTKRVPSEKSPYGKLEKGKVKIRSDKSMGSTYGGKATSQSKAAAAAVGKEAKDKENPKGPKSGYDKVTSAERAKRAVTGDKEKQAMADAKKELDTWQANKKAHKEAELKAARRAVARDRYNIEKREKEQAAEKAAEKEKSEKKAQRKEFFRSKAKKDKGEK